MYGFTISKTQKSCFPSKVKFNARISVFRCLSDWTIMIKMMYDMHIVYVCIVLYV